jgi:hypothetical protein
MNMFIIRSLRQNFPSSFHYQQAVRLQLNVLLYLSLSMGRWLAYVLTRPEPDTTYVIPYCKEEASTLKEFEENGKAMPKEYLIDFPLI